MDYLAILHDLGHVNDFCRQVGEVTWAAERNDEAIVLGWYGADEGEASRCNVAATDFGEIVLNRTGLAGHVGDVLTVGEGTAGLQSSLRLSQPAS